MKQATFQKLNTLLFFVTALASYQGALRGIPWLGLIFFGLLVAVLLPMTEQKSARLFVALAVAAVGFGTDSALGFFQVYRVREEARWLLPAPFCPEWILALWLNFGFMLYFFWRLLNRSVLTAVTVGVCFSFLIYGNAARMGLLALRPPTVASLGTIAVLWAILIPLFTRCAVWRFAGGPHVGSKE